MSTNVQVRPALRGGVIGLGLGRFVFAGRGVGLRVSAAVLASMAGVGGITAGALAGPEGAKVVAGEATIRQNGNRTVIRAGDRTIIDYTRFNVGANERVRFIQPGANARVLNRISGAEPTRIDGIVRANGIVYFVNPAGVMFGQGAVINTNGLYAAGANLSNSDFLNGVNNFTNVVGDVVNQGTINSPQAALIGQHVINSGVIDTGGDPNGIVTMVAGDEVVLSRDGETMSVRVSPDNAALRDPARAGVENSGRINARGGRARIMAGDMYSLAIKDTGTTTARDVKIQGTGTGLVRVGGTIDASDQGAGGTGGRVEITGRNVALTGANIDASGAKGGGQVYVGGERQGAGTQVSNATTTYVSRDSVIKADATERGRGGEVIVWSDTHSAIYGTISAKGGAQGGNGGFIETSGKQTLDLRSASVDASAARGRAGTWLLDPYNVTITAAGVGVDDISGTNYTPTGDNAQVSAQSISSALSGGPSGTNVVITTGLSGSPGTQSGHLVVNAPILKNSTTTATLTLQAAGDLTVGQSITSAGGGRLNVDLLAEASTITIDAPITTGGGTFTSTSGTTTTINQTINTTGSGADGAVSITASDVTFGLVSGALAAGTANISLIPTAGVTNVNVNAGSADFSITAADLARLGTTGSVLIGQFGGSQTVTMNSSALDLSGTPSVYSLVLRGGTLALNNALTMGAGKSFVTQMNGNVTLGGAITFSAANAANSVQIGAGTGDVTISSGINTSGGAFSSDGAAFTANAPITTTGGAITLTHSGVLTLNDSMDASGGTGTGQVTLVGSDLVLNTGTGSIGGGTGGVRFLPVLGTTTLSIGSGGGAGIYEISAAELGRVSVATGGTVVLGSSGAAYNLSIGAVDLSGIMGQSGANYAFGGNNANFGGTFRVRNNAAVTFNTATVNGDPLALDVEFAGTGGVLAVNTTGNATLGTNAGTLAESTIGGNLDIGFRESVLQVGALSVTGTTRARTFNDAGANLTLENVDNSFGAAVTLGTFETDGTTVANGDISVVTTTGDLTVASARAGGDITLSSDDTLNINGAVDAGGMINLAAGTLTNINAAVTAGGRVTVTSPDVAIQSMGGSITAGADGVLIQPLLDTTTIAINDPLTGGLSLSLAELLRITTPGQVIIGREGQTGEMRVGGDGEVNLVAAGYDLVLRAGDINFATGAPRGTLVGGIVLADNQQLSLISAGAIRGRGMTSPDVTIGGNAGALLAVAADGISLWSSVAQIAGDATAGNIRWTNTGGPGLTVTQLSYTDPVTTATASADGLRVGNAQNIQLEVGTTLALSRAVVAPRGFVDIATSGTIFVPGTTDSRVTADRLRVSVLNGSIGGGSTLYTTLGGVTAGRLEANARFGIDINNGFGSLLGLNLDPVSLNASSGFVKLVNSGTIVQAAGAPWVGNGFDVRSSGNFIWLKEGVQSAGAARFESPRVIILSTGKSIDAGTNDVTLVAGDLALEGSIIARNTLISGSTAAQRTIGVGTATGDMTIDNDELSRIDTNSLTINGDTVTRITVAGVDLTSNTAPNRVVFGAGDPTGRVVFNGAASSFRAVNVLANNGVDFDTNVSSTVGELFVNGDFDGMASPSLPSDRINIASGVTLTAETGLTLRAATGGISGAGNVSLLADEGIIIAGNYTNTAGNTTVNSDNDADGAGTFVYESGGTMTLGDSMTGRNLTITAADIDLQGALNAAAGTISIARSTSGEIWLGDVSMAPMGALTMDTSELANISGAHFAIGGTNTTLMHVAGLRNNVLNGLDNTRMTVTGSITLTSDDITITPNALLAEQADLVITRGTAGTVGVGFATGDMTLDINELNRISGKSLTIRNINTATPTDNTTRDIRVTDVTESDISLIAGKFALEAGNMITLTDTMPGDPARFRFKEFSATANDGLDVNASITTTMGDLTLNGDLDNTAQDSDKITIRLNKSLASGRDLIIDGDGGATAEGGLNMSAARDVSLQTNVTTQGDTIVRADSDNSGSGAFIVGVGSRLNTSSNNLTITAADVQLGGDASAANAVAIQTGGGAVSIDRTTLGTLNLGAFTNASGAASSDPMIITNAELGRILSTGLTIGGANTNLMRVEGVTAAASDRIAGVTTLQALGTAGAITFDTSASTFNTLKAVADSGVTVNRTITADTGGIELDGAGNTAGFGDGLVTLNADLLGNRAGDSAVRSNVVLGATTVTVSGKDVTFNGTIDSDTTAARAIVVNSATAGTTTFARDVGVTRRLASVRTNEGGTDIVGGSILAQQFINLGGGVEMTGANPTLETTGGTGIRMGGVSKIKGTISAAGATGDVRFADRVTATDNVTITTLGGGEVLFREEARLRGSITTTGDGNVNFGGALGTNGNLTITTQDTGIVAFRRNIFSANGTHDLTITVPRPSDDPPASTPSAPNPLPPVVPTVRFGGAIGKLANGTAAPLGNLTINGAGRTVVPRQATIVGTTTAGLDINLTGNFVVGQNEKITSLGGVSINANKITVGDISARDSITLNASSGAADAITIRNRAAQQLLAVEFNPDRPAAQQTLELIPLDDGLDIVSAFGIITFNRLPTIVGAGPAPRLATGTGELGGNQANYTGLLSRQFQNASDPTAVTFARFAEIARNGTRFLDLTASGPSTTNFASGVAQAIPRDNRVNVVGQENAIDPATKDALSDMALNPREPNVKELLDLLVGAATFDDTPGKVGQAQASDYKVVLNRLPYRPTRNLADSYLEIFGERAVRSERLASIRGAFNESAKRFRESSGFKGKSLDPIAFRAFIEQNASEAATLGYTRQLAEFFERLKALGLTVGEENRVRGGLLRQIQPSGQFSSIREFEKLFVETEVSVR